MAVNLRKDPSNRIIKLERSCFYLNQKKKSGIIKFTIVTLIGSVVILLTLLILVDRERNSIYYEMEIDNPSVPPSDDKITYRKEVAKPGLVFVKYTTEGSGEEDSKRSIADSITGLKEHYSIVIIDMIDKNNEDWYAVYIDNENSIRLIEDTSPEDLTEVEKKVKDYYESLDDPKSPILKYSKNPILE